MNVGRLQPKSLGAHKSIKCLYLEKQIGKPFYRSIIVVHSKAWYFTRYQETYNGTIVLRAAKMAYEYY